MAARPTSSMIRPWFTVAFALLLVAGPARGGALHAFDTDNEGWQVVSYPFRSHVASPAMQALPWDGSFGNPAGSVRVGDVAPETGIAAPADHLGDQSAIYGDTLRYDIFLRFSDNVTYPAVVLNGGTMSLYYDAPSPPIGAWETRVVPLSEAGWRVSGSQAVASQADFQAVLQNLAGIYIYTEWNTGADDTNVDNISLPIARATGVGRTPNAARLAFLPVFPNPSSGSTTLSLAVDRASVVTVDVFDVSGRRVRALASQYLVADHAGFSWDGKTDQGESAPSGIYFARAVTASGETTTRKFVRIR